MPRRGLLLLAACALAVPLLAGCGNACFKLADQICSCQPDDTSRANCQSRARDTEKIFPVIFKGSRYGNRLPIGKPEIIQGGKAERIKQYYKDWYRPDLMAVIAVGDFDPVAMEADIKAKFGDLVNPKPPRPHNAVPVPREEFDRLCQALDEKAGSHAPPSSNIRIVSSENVEKVV